MAGIDSLYSVASSIGEKISNFSLGDIVNGVAGGARGALDAAGYPSLKMQSKFQTNDLPKVAGVNNSVSPEEAKKDRVRVSGALEFPSGMKHYTKFTFFEYDRSGVTVIPNLIISKVFVLPMPANLQEGFNVTYDEPMLGPIVGKASDSLINAMRTNNLPEVGREFGKNVLTGGVAGALNSAKSGSSILGDVGKDASALYMKAMGVAPNPGIAVLFSNINLRTHSFSYKFAPTSKKELDTLKTIISELKRRMLPGLDPHGGMLFTFPDVCNIEFGPEKDKPYTIKQCVMDNMSVNYSPMGSPAFFKTNDPVMVEITMSFKETSPFTREDLKQGDVLLPPTGAGGGRGGQGGAGFPPAAVEEINPRDRR